MQETPPRHVEIAFPAYAFVPGRGPHPRRSPRGHSFGDPEPEAEAPRPASWRCSRLYLFGVDLYNAGYFWEAHEQWEAVWHAAGRAGAVADFLKGLIQTAAAHVKREEGRPRGVAILAAKSRELLSAVRERRGPRFMGLDLVSFLTAHRVYFDALAAGGSAPFPHIRLADG